MSLRRMAGLALALSMAIVPYTLWPVGASASGGTLFAITGPGQSVLSRVDPVNGTITPLTADLGGPNQGQLGTITGDPATHRIFAVRTTVSFDNNGNFLVTNEVLTIDSQTGQVLTVSPDIGKPVSQIAFDSISGVLYLMSFNAVYRLNPTTGATALVANLGDLGPTIMSMVVLPGGNTMLINSESAGFGNSDQILSVNTQNGTVTTGPQLTQLVRIVAYDANAGALVGASECCPRQLLRIDPVTGAETPVAAFSNSNDQGLQFAMAVDPSSNTVFMDLQTFTGFTSTESQIVTVNDQSGATGVSPLINDIVWSEYFEPVVMTAESIKSDVRQALASGGITQAGVAESLLAKLNAASAARSRGQCSTASANYRAFLNDVKAQTGKDISAGTANTLSIDAQYLMAHCP